MAVTPTEQLSILELVVLLFDAAPGATYLPLIDAAYEAAGHDLANLAAALDDTGAFLSLHPSNESASDFADAFLTPLGLQDDALSRDFVISRLQAGATKGEIAYQAWAVLESLPDGVASRYLDAKAILEHKAEVALHYSVDLAGAATSVAELQAVLAGVTADPASVVAAIDVLDDALATGPALTQGHDFIQVPGTQATNVTGSVDGDADHHTGTGTYNNGDIVVGNGNTNVFLTVREGGEAPDASLQYIETVYLSAQTVDNITFNAAGWVSVGQVRYDAGLDGMQVRLHDLEASTDVAIADVTGSLTVDYDVANSLTVSLVNALPGETSEFSLAADGDVAASIGAGAFAEIDALGEIGDVHVSGGEHSVLSMTLSSTTDLSLGDVDFSGRDGAALELHVTDVSGDLSAGGVSFVAQGAGDINAIYTDVSGDATLGSFDLSAGDGAFLRVDVGSVGGSLTAGDASLTAGVGAREFFLVDGVAGDIEIGDVSLAAEGAATVEASIAGSGEGTLTLGSVSVDAGGADSDASVFVHDFASAVVGDIESLAQHNSSAVVEVKRITGALDVGDVTVGGDGATTARLSLHAIDGDVTAGALSASGGDDAQVNVDLHDIEGSIHAGAVDAAGGDGAIAIVDLHATGDLVAGEVSLSVGDAGTVSAEIDTVNGDLSLEGAHLAAGEAAFIDWSATLFTTNEPVLGDYTVGDFSVQAAADSFLVVELTQSLVTLATDRAASVGAFEVGDIDFTIGDNASVGLAITQLANAAAATSFADGAFSVGDVSIAVSATATAELSGGSTIGVSIAKTALAGAGTGEDFTVGDVSLSGGDTADFNVGIGYDGSFDQLGDFAIGTVSIAAGDMALGHIGISVTNSAGSIGDVGIGGIAMNLGDGAQGSVDVLLQKSGVAGDVGDVSLGDWTLVAGDNASLLAAFSGAGLTADAGIGNVTLGDLALDIGDLSTAMVSLDFIAGTIGTATFGDVDVTVGDGASAVVRLAMTADDAGDMTIGDIALTPGGSIDLVVTHMGDANDTLTLGDITVALAGTEAADEARLEVTAAGDVVIGDVTVSGEGTLVLDGLAHTATSDVNTSFLYVSAGGDITLGDVDFSGYENDVTLDLSWVDHGAAHIASGAGDDVILGTSGANVIDAGAGFDSIDISQGGNDTVVTHLGDSGITLATIETISGFAPGVAAAGDKLSFGLAAGTAGNFVEESANLAGDDLATFIANATDALNSTVLYFVQDNGVDTFVAVSFGSGEPDLIVRLAGIADATTLNYQHIVA